MPELNRSHLSNIELIFKIAEDFSHDAEIDFKCSSLDKKTLVIESGHQPNFLPHAGLFKKIFLLHLCRKRANDKGRDAIALFGFSDYNLCTTKLLTQNKFPAFNKLGYERLGFKIAERDVWKRFDYLMKPPEDEWERAVQKISSHYKRYPIAPDTELRLTEIIETLEDCYKKAKNFPDINAFFISKISNKLALDVSFFRYSDIQRKGIFIERWSDIISDLRQYNSIYNSSIEHHHLDIPLCDPDLLPFWYHCPCGAKVQVMLNQGYATGICRICTKKHEIDLNKLKDVFKDLSPNAVARNVIFSEGMGTHIFISGTGGWLEYSKISDNISRRYGFNLPVTISWKGRDYYTGPAHEAALTELARICGIKRANILIEDITRMIKDKRKELEERAADAREKGKKNEIKKYEGDYKNIGTSIDISKAIFTSTPSFMDILVSQGIKNIGECWTQTLDENNEGSVIIKDVVYDSEAFNIYKKIEGII